MLVLSLVELSLNFWPRSSENTQPCIPHATFLGIDVCYMGCHKEMAFWSSLLEKAMSSIMLVDKVTLLSSICVIPSPLYIHRHTHTAVFMDLICWSRMEPQVVSNWAWRSLRARNGHEWQLWVHTCICSALRFPHPFTLLICFTFLFYSILIIPSSPPLCFLSPSVISECSQAVLERGG